MKKQPKLVRFVSPYGSPAWMRLEQAEKLRDEDDARWEEQRRLGIPLSEYQREVGAPRIEHRR